MISPCPRCQGTRFWQLSSIREQQGDGVPVPLAPELIARVRTRTELRMGRAASLAPFRFEETEDPYTVAKGHFEALVCRGCGHTRWSVRELDSLSQLERTDHACPDCQVASFRRVPEVQERAEGVPVRLNVIQRGPEGGAGRFEVLISDGCGRAFWYARELEKLEPHPKHRLKAVETGTPCSECKSARSFELETFEERGDGKIVPLHLALWGGAIFYHSTGHFSLAICRDCGHVEWYAKGFEGLRENHELGIAAVEALPPPPAGGQGPYR